MIDKYEDYILENQHRPDFESLYVNFVKTHNPVHIEDPILGDDKITEITNDIASGKDADVSYIKSLCGQCSEQELEEARYPKEMVYSLALDARDVSDAEYESWYEDTALKPYLADYPDRTKFLSAMGPSVDEIYDKVGEEDFLKVIDILDNDKHPLLSTQLSSDFGIRASIRKLLNARRRADLENRDSMDDIVTYETRSDDVATEEPAEFSKKESKAKTKAVPKASEAEKIIANQKTRNDAGSNKTTAAKPVKDGTPGEGSAGIKNADRPGSSSPNDQSMKDCSTVTNEEAARMIPGAMYKLMANGWLLRQFEKEYEKSKSPMNTDWEYAGDPSSTSATVVSPEANKMEVADPTAKFLAAIKLLRGGNFDEEEAAEGTTEEIQEPGTQIQEAAPASEPVSNSEPETQPAQPATQTQDTTATSSGSTTMIEDYEKPKKQKKTAATQEAASSGNEALSAYKEGLKAWERQKSKDRHHDTFMRIGHSIAETGKALLNGGTAVTTNGRVSNVVPYKEYQPYVSDPRLPNGQ